MKKYFKMDKQENQLKNLIDAKEILIKNFESRLEKLGLNYYLMQFLFKFYIFFQLSPKVSFMKFVLPCTTT
ncbi:unnamed protein product [Paramecium octaurelia]|uniref:Uncharacterized protein n=1 Tax=Paramecium octaurelia TaxID=43137 RepID=A0A8S1TVY5_PAROT|nr:unnamed protein product [Paramecium octaurelia]